MKQFFQRLFLFTGLLCFVLLGMLLYQRYHPNPLAFKGVVITRELSASKKRKPLWIQIPSVKINLPIETSEIQGTNWTTTDLGVSYLESTPLPGEAGNAILYGHNLPNLLGPLHKVRVGDKIIVSYPGDRTVEFTVSYITVVSPDQVKILENSKDSRLTIYTCTGFLDGKRFVVTAMKN